MVCVGPQPPVACLHDVETIEVTTNAGASRCRQRGEKMRKCILLLVLALTTACGVSAQEAKVVFHPGDQIHILVTFKAAPASLEGGTFTFALEGQPDKAQELLNRGLYGNQIHKVSETQYEITGTIPEHVVSGHYGLAAIGVGIMGVGKQYSAKTDFSELTIT